MEDTIQKLREAVDMLEKRQAYLDKKIEIQTQQAKKLAKTNRPAAIQALKLQKLFLNQRQKIDGTMLQLHHQMSVLEDAQQNKDVLGAMKQGTEQLKQVHKSMNVEKVDDLMDELHEQMGLQQDIGNAMATPILDIPGADDDDLLAELEEMEAEEMDQKLSQVDLPAAPRQAIVPKAQPMRKTAEEEELDALTASMGL